MRHRLSVFQCVRRLVEAGWEGMSEQDAFAVLVAHAQGAGLPLTMSLAALIRIADHARLVKAAPFPELVR